jgi:CubicO group peptidase (beta-lactamase class C family)
MENETPVTPATRFRIGGVSQCLTAAAAGLLSERGRLDLDAPVQRYVTDFPEKEWPFSARQLMGNVAGIRPHRSEAGILRGSGCTDDAGRLAGFAGDPLVFRPGTARAYSTHAWALAGAVIAAAANEPYPEFMRREVFAPLQMDSTVPDIAGRSDPDAATFYYPRFALDPRLGLQDSPQVDLACHLPAAGFLSTPSDLVRFGSAMMGGRLLDPATVAELWIPVRLESGEPTGESLGWSWSTLFDAAGDSTRVVGRGLGDVVVRRPLSATTVEGQVAGSTTSLLTVPRHFIAVAVATNVSGAGNVPLLATRLAGIFIARLSGLPPGPTGG